MGLSARTVKCQESRGTSNIDSIVTARKPYKDGLHVQLQAALEENQERKVYYQKNCVQVCSPQQSVVVSTAK